MWLAGEPPWLVPSVVPLQLTQNLDGLILPCQNMWRERLNCRNCGNRRQFIPIDETIPSISDVDLSELYYSVRGFNEKVQLERLQEQRPSSRYHRWQKPAAKTTSNVAKTTPKKKERVPRMLQPEHVESRPDKGPVATKCTLCHEKGAVNYHSQWLVGSDVYQSISKKNGQMHVGDMYRRMSPLDTSGRGN